MGGGRIGGWSWEEGAGWVVVRAGGVDGWEVEEWWWVVVVVMVVVVVVVVDLLTNVHKIHKLLMIMSMANLPGFCLPTYRWKPNPGVA